MYALNALAFLAVAGSVIALPHGERDVKIVYETVVATDYETVAYGSQPTSEVKVKEYKSHSRHHTVVATPTPTPTPAYTPPAYTPTPQPAKPSSAAPSSAAPSAPASTGAPATGGYMDVVTEWRKKLGLPALTQDSKLEANALKTCNDGNGQMVHELNPGTMGQVLAPGQPDGFLKVFVGGWLCEEPSLPGLNGICSSMSQGWAYNGQTPR